MYLETTTSLAIQSIEKPGEEGEGITIDWRTELEAYLRDEIISAKLKVAFPLNKKGQTLHDAGWSPLQDVFRETSVTVWKQKRQRTFSTKFMRVTTTTMGGGGDTG